jgi:coproporphyrinogen III oxidase-like Fe-S oxidoreductase
MLSPVAVITPLEPSPSQPTAAYIHIPFCRRRCFYCDFAIAVMGDRARGDTSPTMQTYVDTLCREIQATPMAAIPLKTIFFGGGTPSLLAPKLRWNRF